MIRISKQIYISVLRWCSVVLITLTLHACSKCGNGPSPEFPPLDLSHSRDWVRLTAIPILKGYSEFNGNYKAPGKSILIFADTIALDSFRKSHFNDSSSYYNNTIQKSDYFYIAFTDGGLTYHNRRTTFWINTETSTLEVYYEALATRCDEFGGNYSYPGTQVYALPKAFEKYNIVAQRIQLWDY